MTVPPKALAAARAAAPFVNSGACQRILEAGAPAIEADVRERCARLAENYQCPCGDDDCDGADTLRGLAGLLRDQP